MWNNATIVNPPNFQPKNCSWVLKNSTFKSKWVEGKMPLSTVKIICPENEDDVSSVINVTVYFWKNKLIIMKKAMANPITIMTTSMTVICQKLIALMTINNVIQ